MTFRTAFGAGPHPEVVHPLHPSGRLENDPARTRRFGPPPPLEVSDFALWAETNSASVSRGVLPPRTTRPKRPFRSPPPPKTNLRVNFFPLLSACFFSPLFVDSATTPPWRTAVWSIDVGPPRDSRGGQSAFGRTRRPSRVRLGSRFHVSDHPLMDHRPLSFSLRSTFSDCA